MSSRFWGGFGSNKSNDLPSARSTRDSPQQPSPAVPPAASGPPPTATTYRHSPRQPASSSPPQQHAAGPKFQIFVPSSADSTADKELNDDEDHPAYEQQTPATSIQQEEEEEEEEDWDILEEDETVEPSKQSNPDDAEDELHFKEDEMVEHVPQVADQQLSMSLARDSHPTLVSKPFRTKSRREFDHQLHQLDMRLAGVEAKCCEEERQRNQALRTLAESQLERLAIKYITGHELSHPQEEIQALYQRVAALRTNMIQHKHATMAHLEDEELQHLRETVVQHIQPTLQLEVDKAAKRQVVLVGKLQTLVNTVARRYWDESATAKAALTVLQDALKDSASPEPDFQLLAQIKALRQELAREREARKDRDAQILQEIHESYGALRRVLLQAAGGDIVS